MSSDDSTLSTHSDATQAGEQAQKTTVRGGEGQPGPALHDAEKGGGGDSADEADNSREATDAGEKAGEPERDQDGVAIEDGVPIVRLTGPDDPLS